MKAARTMVSVVLSSVCVAFFAGCHSAKIHRSSVAAAPSPPQLRTFVELETDVTVAGSYWTNIHPATFFDLHRSLITQDLLRSLITSGQTLPSRDEELWVVAKQGAPVRAEAPAEAVDLASAGVLVARFVEQQVPVYLPLKHTIVRADIVRHIASVAVTQQFQNPFSSKIEAVYAFRLPHNAAVNDFVMTIGDRKIRGVIRERAEAERIYARARLQGYVASLLTQDRHNVFAQSVANIEPGKQIDVDLKYSHELLCENGWYNWCFPMVVGPHLNLPARGPGASSPRSGVIADPHFAADLKTDALYGKPQERSGRDVTLAVNVAADPKMGQLDFPIHKIDARNSEGHVAVTLLASDRIPNKDFVLRYRVASEKSPLPQVAGRGEGGNGPSSPFGTETSLAGRAYLSVDATAPTAATTRPVMK
jgi:hypothetical protein